MVITKQDSKKPQPQFGRPLIPFFLSQDSANDLKVNTELSLPPNEQQKQRELVVPDGEQTFTVREFKDGYFEHKEHHVGHVMTDSQAPQIVSINANHFNANKKNHETFETTSTKPQRASPASRHARNNSLKKDTDYHYQNYYNMVVKNKPQSQACLDTSTDTLLPSSQYAKLHSGSSSPPKPISRKNKKQTYSPSASAPSSNFRHHIAKEKMSAEESFVDIPALSDSYTQMPLLITPEFLLSNNSATLSPAKSTIKSMQEFLLSCDEPQQPSATTSSLSDDEDDFVFSVPNQDAPEIPHGFKTPSPPRSHSVNGNFHQESPDAQKDKKVLTEQEILQQFAHNLDSIHTKPKPKSLFAGSNFGNSPPPSALPIPSWKK